MQYSPKQEDIQQELIQRISGGFDPVTSLADEVLLLHQSALVRIAINAGIAFNY